MITEEQTIQKFQEMLCDAEKTIRTEVRRLLKSGAIDPEAYENNYELPKKLLYVALLNTAEQYLPPDGEHEDIKNLKHF